MDSFKYLEDISSKDDLSMREIKSRFMLAVSVGMAWHYLEVLFHLFCSELKLNKILMFCLTVLLKDLNTIKLYRKKTAGIYLSTSASKKFLHLLHETAQNKLSCSKNHSLLMLNDGSLTGTIIRTVRTPCAKQFYFSNCKRQALQKQRKCGHN